jgi:phage/plasmid-like protein (TIGR03299 family)
MFIVIMNLKLKIVMADNINVNRFTGKMSFVSAIEPAWHRKGIILPGRFTAEEAILHANMGYTVALAPLYAKFSDDKTLPADQRGTKLDDSFATYRTDTREVFGVVGSRYRIVQNTAAFSFFDSIVGEGKAIFETAGVLGKGETIFLTAKLPKSIVLPGDDIVEQYLLFTMGHDGLTPVSAMFTPTRVVCANTLAIALSNGKSKVVIKHTRSAMDKIKEAGKLMGLVNKTSETTSEILNAMSKVRINDDQLTEYIKLVFLTKEERIRLAETGNHKLAEIPTRTIGVMYDVADFALTGVGQDALSTKGTLFGAYSGVTGWLFNRKEYKNDDARMKSLILNGTDYDLNSKAFNIAESLINEWR